MQNLNKEILDKLGIRTGSKIKIIKMINHPEMTNKIGTVTSITPDYQLKGTWGNRSIVPSADTIEKVE